ncbi:MAG: YicC family protein [Planctomycetes bacterium]|nr:YicC family protein [Planctomycetota bacterium]
MLLSMTGFGAARSEDDQLAVSVEIRAVNNRYLKVTTKCAEPYNVFEPEIERLVRGSVRRGTVQVALRVLRELAAEDFRLNQTAIESYLAQLRPIEQRLGSSVALGQILALPGVVSDASLDDNDPADRWTRIAPTVQQAVERLHQMRVEEGRAMRAELLENCEAIRKSLEQVAARAPQALEGYRDRLHERVRAMLAEEGIEIDRSELIKEVAIFAERSDISEEIVRLRSHLDQFARVVEEPESGGRKLEFLGQEMFREANTIGSKASDVEISQHVVEIKSEIEKIREMVQNVE